MARKKIKSNSSKESDAQEQKRLQKLERDKLRKIIERANENEEKRSKRLAKKPLKLASMSKIQQLKFYSKLFDYIL